MMRATPFSTPLLALSLAMGVSACGGSSLLLHEASPTNDLRDYRSFQLREPQVGQLDDELSRLIRSGLEDRGYREDPQTGELVVTYKLLVGNSKKDGADVSEVARATGDVDMLAIGGQGAGESRNKVLLVLIQDAQTFETVWVGWSQENLSSQDLEVKARQAIGELVDRLPRRQAVPSGT